MLDLLRLELNIGVSLSPIPIIHAEKEEKLILNKMFQYYTAIQTCRKHSNKMSLDFLTLV